MHNIRSAATRPFRARDLTRSVFASAVLLILVARLSGAQTLAGTMIVRVTANGTPLRGITVAARTTNSVTDGLGRATFKLPTGQYVFRAAPPGFRPESLAVFVGVGTTTRDLSFHQQVVLPSVTVIPNRTDEARPIAAAAAVSTAARIPAATTHVEVIDRAALDEQIEQSPGVIADALSRVDGVQMQTLSAGSGGVGIRIRGLPARYTKILMDGLPLVGATPEGQNALQLSALGVDRIDVTPGVTSAFAGPTALGGIVNVVSGTPASPSQIVLNGTTRGALDVSAFQTHTFSPRWAGTLLVGRHERGASDPDNDGWAEVGGYRRLVIRPNAWWTRSPRSSWFMTAGWMSDDRRGGTFEDRSLPVDITVREDANTQRADAGTVGRIQLDTSTVVTVRGSFMREWRERWFRGGRESNRRVGIFGDVAVSRSLAHEQVVTAGMALDRDQYTTLDTPNDYRYTTPAIYGEHTWAPVSWFGLTSNARVDLTQFGDFASPRVTVLVRPTPEWTMRLSRANGVYLPTPLTDETETFGLRYVDVGQLQPEHAHGWALDVDGMTGPIELRASGYRTLVAHPLAVRIPPGSAVGLEIMNADGTARSQGADVSARWRAGALRATAAYSYVDASRPNISTVFGNEFEFDTTTTGPVPYTPRHSGRVETALERSGDQLIGLELRVVGKQTVADSSLAPSRAYATFDARAEKHVRGAILFARGSNLLNVRQSQFTPVVRRAAGYARQFGDNVWAPLDGFVLNAGVRFSY
jgi:outer membrane receptor for ferrienterochelin and colicins